MMIDLIVLSHGDLCEALIATAELVLGKQNHIIAVGYGASENIDTYKERVYKIIYENCSNPILILTDLFGGSPCNIALQFSINEKIECITGMNLPMLLTALTERENSSIEELKEKCINAGKEGILCANCRN